MTEVLETIQIHQFLDMLFKSNLSLTTVDGQTTQIQDQEVEVKESLRLTNNVALHNESYVGQKYHKTFPNLMSEKYSHHIYSSENELRNICKTIALTPDWILSKKEVYPWPHPKNIRYVDYYVKTVLVNGRKRKKTVARCQDVPVRCKKVEGLFNRETIEELLKKRKQKRARGIKKKK